MLINNAGIFHSPLEKTKQGLDIRLAVNYYAPYLLTNDLMPLMEKGNNSRIINLSSAAKVPVSMNALLGKKDLSVQEAYAQSKLAMTMWSFQLAQNKKNLNTIAVNPGSLLNTKMVQEAYGQFWSPAEKGSNIIFDLALSEEYKGSSGKYFDNDKGEEKGLFGPAHPDAYDQTKIDELISTTDLYLKNFSV